MKNHVRHMFMVVLAIALLSSSVLVIREWQQKQAAQRAYEEAQALAAAAAEAEATKELEEEPVPLVEDPVSEEPVQDPLEENALFLMDLDLGALRATNADVLGWIHIPNTPIDFPLMKSADNADYLNTTWDGRASSLGSIFLECMNNPDLSDFNTIVYGHNIRGGRMFGSLHYFKDPAWQQAHPFVYIVTDEGVRRYEIFAAYEAPVTSDTYRLYFEDDARKLASLEHYVGSSVWHTDTELGVNDHILTLSTCTGTGRYETRWVVQAVQTGLFAAE